MPVNGGGVTDGLSNEKRCHRNNYAPNCDRNVIDALDRRPEQDHKGKLEKPHPLIFESGRCLCAF